MAQVSELIARPIRTLPQAAIAYAIAEFWDSFINDLTEKQYGALVGILVILLSALQIAVERLSGLALFRKTGPVPVTNKIVKGPVVN